MAESLKYLHENLGFIPRTYMYISVTSALERGRQDDPPPDLMSPEWREFGVPEKKSGDPELPERS